MKQLHGRFWQTGQSTPTLFGQFGDTIVAGATFSFAANPSTRLGVGDYLIDTADDLMDSQGNVPFRGCVHATLHQNATAKTIRAGVEDVNKVRVKTFDSAGNPVDVGGEFYLTVFLNDEGF